MNAQVTKVGFIGLGTMGNPMASNIAKSGAFDLKVFDVDHERASALAAEIGAIAAREISELADREVIVLMLPTSVIVHEALIDDTGQPTIPAAPGTVFVDMSSSDPSDTVDTGTELARAGFVMCDAPVSGARERAELGTLSIMLGSDDEAAAERALPVIHTMSNHVFRTGRLGTGHAMKALNNYVAAAAFTAAAEALDAGESFGLDPATMVGVFNASTGQSFVTTHVLPEHVVGGKFASGFALPLFTKDVRIAQRIQQVAGKTAPVCDAVTSAMGDALDALGNVDHTRAVEFWRNR